jgi:hypothetical protein
VGQLSLAVLFFVSLLICIVSYIFFVWFDLFTVMLQGNLSVSLMCRPELYITSTFRHVCELWLSDHRWSIHFFAVGSLNHWP